MSVCLPPPLSLSLALYFTLTLYSPSLSVSSLSFSLFNRHIQTHTHRCSVNLQASISYFYSYFLICVFLSTHPSLYLSSSLKLCVSKLEKWSLPVLHLAYTNIRSIIQPFIYTYCIQYGAWPKTANHTTFSFFHFTSLFPSFCTISFSLF